LREWVDGEDHLWLAPWTGAGSWLRRPLDEWHRLDSTFLQAV